MSETERHGNRFAGIGDRPEKYPRSDPKKFRESKLWDKMGPVDKHRSLDRTVAVDGICKYELDPCDPPMCDECIWSDR